MKLKLKKSEALERFIAGYLTEDQYYLDSEGYYHIQCEDEMEIFVFGMQYGRFKQKNGYA